MWRYGDGESADVCIDGLEHEGQGHPARAVSGRDGCGNSLAASAATDRAALPQAGNGRQPLGLEKMLRIYFLQQWFNLSDPQAEDAIYDSESMRRFARVELGDDVVPDETTILRFRSRQEFRVSGASG